MLVVVIVVDDELSHHQPTWLKSYGLVVLKIQTRPAPSWLGSFLALMVTTRTGSGVCSPPPPPQPAVKGTSMGDLPDQPPGLIVGPWSHHQWLCVGVPRSPKNPIKPPGCLAITREERRLYLWKKNICSPSVSLAVLSFYNFFNHIRLIFSQIVSVF
jgi:hypothetical protein